MLKKLLVGIALVDTHEVEGLEAVLRGRWNCSVDCSLLGVVAVRGQLQFGDSVCVEAQAYLGAGTGCVWIA